MKEFEDVADETAEAAPPPLPYRPSIFAAPFQKGGDGHVVELLSVAEQDALIAISQLVSVRRHTPLYTEGGEARFVYNVVSGVAETYQLLPNGDKHITAFLFAHDLLGLSVDGRYVATAQALTPVVAYRIPVDALAAVLERDPRLDIGLLCKLCHELRASQHHTITVSKHEASARLAGFLLWLEHVYVYPGRVSGELTLPMSRNDVADYVGLSVESVSRALSFLEAQGAVRRKGPRTVVLLDVAKLRRLAGQA